MEIDSLKYLYFSAQQKRDPHLLTVYSMVSKHLKQESNNTLHLMLKMTNHVAIHQKRITTRQKQKIRDQRFNLNGHNVYIVPRLSAWQYGVELMEDQFIY